MGIVTCENYVEKIAAIKSEATELENFNNAWRCGTGKGVPSCVEERELISQQVEWLRAYADALEKLCEGRGVSKNAVDCQMREVVRQVDSGSDHLNLDAIIQKCEGLYSGKINDFDETQFPSIKIPNKWNINKWDKSRDNSDEELCQLKKISRQIASGETYLYLDTIREKCGQLYGKLKIFHKTYENLAATNTSLRSWEEEHQSQTALYACDQLDKTCYDVLVDSAQICMWSKE